MADEKWSDIEKRALADWRYMETLSVADKQMLHSFLTFTPELAVKDHIIVQMKSCVVRDLLGAIGQPGGVWQCYDRIPFDQFGRVYVEQVLDGEMLSDHFKLWASPINQEVVYEFAETRFDEQAFSSIIPAFTAPDIIRQIRLLNPYEYKECLDGFYRLLPYLDWMMVLLKPTAQFGMLVVSDRYSCFLRNVQEMCVSKEIRYFKLVNSDGRFVWPGPTEWERAEGAEKKL